MDFSFDLLIRVLRYLPQAILFYVLLFFIGRYFYRRIPNTPWRPPEDTVRIPGGWMSAAAIYILLTLIYFAPDLTRLGSMLIGPPEDNMQSYWNLWYGWEVLRGHYPSLMYTKMIGYPEGVSMLYHSYSYYNLGLSFVLRFIDGLVLAYNLLIMHAFVVGGLGGFFLGRYLLRNDYQALIVGFIFAFAPFHFARVMHHINIASTQFVPFFVLFFIRAIRERKFRYSFLAAVFLALNGLASWAYLILGLYFMILAYPYLALRRGRVFLWDVIGRSFLVAGITFVLLSPLLVPMIISSLSHHGVYKGGHSDYVADLAGLFIPNAAQWLGHMPQLKNLTSMFTGNPWESAVYLGISAILIVILTARRTLAESSRYILGLLACLVLAMGSWMHVMGWSTRVALPYNVLAHVPFFSNMRAPDRHIVYVYLFLAILVAIGIGYLYRSRKGTSRAKVLVVALVALVAVDYYSYDAHMTPVKLPPVYTAILQNGGGPILDLPLESFRKLGHAMFYQTMHHQPLVTAYVSRKIDNTLAERLHRHDIDEQLQQLSENHVPYIVVHKHFLDAAPYLDTLAYDTRCRKLYSDSAQIVYVFR